MDPTPGSVTAEELLEQAGFLRRLAGELVRDAHQAADLVQDTYVAALERPPGRPGPIRAWLATVAANLARNARRGERRRAAREELAARPERMEPGDVPLETLEVQRALFELVLGLAPERRTVLYLRYYEGLTPTRIAERLGVPVKTVKTRHTRALSELRERLDARSGGDRSRWLAALLPLSVPRGGGLALTGMLGGVAMKKLVVAAVAVVLAVLAWRTIAPGLLEELRVRRSLAGGERVASRPVETEPAELAPALAPEVLQERRPLGPDDPPTTGGLRLAFRRSDGTPASDLPLAVECLEDPAPRTEVFRARTDGDGSATVEDLFAGPVRVWLDRDRFDAEVEAGATRAFEFTLTELFTVEGTVVDPEGAPVEGAEIWCGRTSARRPGGFLLATSASDGTFRLRDVDAFSAVGARKRGHLPSQGWNPIDMSGGADGVRSVRLVLGAAGGSVRGRVLDPDGNPLERAGVLAGPDGGWTSGAKPGSSPELAFAETDEHGEFELRSDLPPGKHPIHAAARGFPVWRAEMEVVAGQTTSIDIRLERAARIEGRLLGVDGSPAAGVTVLASEEDRGGWYHDRFAPSESVTDEQGWFALDWVAPGLRELNAHDFRRPEIGRARASVSCAAGETATCELRLELGRTISGRVVDEDDLPLAGWAVKSEAPLLRNWYPRRATTDAQGHFLLANLGEGAHDLIVRSPDLDDHPRAKVEAVPTGTEELVIVVADAHVARGTLRGRFVAPAGTRADGFTLTLWEAGGDEGHFLEPDAAGVFEAEVVPGSYRVRIAGGGKELATSATFDVESGGLTDMGELRIEVGGRVEIAVHGLPPASLEHIRFSLEREGCSSVRLEAVDGLLRSPEVMPGTWTVSMAENELRLVHPEVEVVSGTTVRAEIEVERAR